MQSGEDCFLTAVLSTGRGEADISQSILVRFIENDVGPIQVDLVARVRNPLSVSAGDLKWERGDAQSIEKKTICVNNFDSADWQELKIISNVDWLNLSTKMLAVPEEGARQSWCVIATPKVIGLDAANRQGTLLVSGVTADSKVREILIPVELILQPRANAFPQCWFVHPGFTKDRKLSCKLIFRDGNPLRDYTKTDVELSENLRELLEVKIRPT